MIKVLVSACLLGEKVRYHGGDARCASDILERWNAEGRIVPVCPETAAGLPVPRPPAEIAGGDGHAVLEQKALVSYSTGVDVTTPFIQGAQEALAVATSHGARLAVLKDGSPSCGSSYIFDGTFRGQRDQGQGITAALLTRAGIRVFNERQLEDAARYLEALESEQRRD